MQVKVRQAKATMQVQNEVVIATFAKRAKGAAIAAGATSKEVEAARQAATADAATTFADSIAMQE